MLWEFGYELAILGKTRMVQSGVLDCLFQLVRVPACFRKSYVANNLYRLSSFILRLSKVN